jgi:hypothetical protein
VAQHAKDGTAGRLPSKCGCLPSAKARHNLLDGQSQNRGDAPARLGAVSNDHLTCSIVRAEQMATGQISQVLDQFREAVMAEGIAA